MEHIHCGFCKDVFKGQKVEHTIAIVTYNLPSLTECLTRLREDNIKVQTDTVCQQCEVDWLIPHSACVGYHPWYPNIKFYKTNDIDE